ncbi:MAG: RHS repeat-associated core domain-containing protein, partial [Pseudomonadota bacterium]
HRIFSRTGRERSYDGAGNLTLDAPMGAAPIDPPPGGGGTESAAYEGTMQAMEEDSGDTPPPGAVSRAYSYNAANRMSGTSLGGEHLMSYRYNGRGERVYRQGADRTVHTVFDHAGRWIGDYDANGAIVQQAIWLGDLPVGLLAKDSGVTRLFHIEADALGSPRTVIDPTRGARGTVVWRWELAGEAFGNDTPNEDPDGDDVAFALDMRYPGQQYDSASELNYNYFRGYEASAGRYVESDPIGLDGGISTYGYVGGNPTTGIDPFGLYTTSADHYCVRFPAQCTGQIPRPPNLSPPALGTGISATIWCWLADCTVASSSGEGGLADGPAPYDHYEETAALNFMPDPFGGNEACKQLAHAIRVLRAQTAWRKTDLNPRSARYQDHVTFRAGLLTALIKLEAAHRNICGGDCPP